MALSSTTSFLTGSAWASASPLAVLRGSPSDSASPSRASQRHEAAPSGSSPSGAAADNFAYYTCEDPCEVAFWAFPKPSAGSASSTSSLSFLRSLFASPASH